MRKISEVIGVFTLYVFTFVAVVLLGITIADIVEYFIDLFNQTLFDSRFVSLIVVAAGWWLLTLFLSFTIHVTCGGGLSNQENGENVVLATVVCFGLLAIAFLGSLATTALELIISLF